MKITFIMLCYNQEKEIIRAVNSIAYSGIPKDDYEIIISDDGSTDNSIGIMRSHDMIDCIIDMKKNTRNQSLLRNLAIKKAKGEYIMFCDGDDYFDSYDLNLVYHELLKTSEDIHFLKTMHMNSIQSLYKTEIIESVFDESIIPTMEIPHGPTCLAIKRSYILENNLFFDEVKYNYDSEDMYFFYNIIANTDSRSYSNISFCSFKKSRVGNNTSEKFDKGFLYLDYLSEMIIDLKKEIRSEHIHRIIDIYGASEAGRIINYMYKGCGI